VDGLKAIDRASKFLFVRLQKKASRKTAWDVPKGLITAPP
jgi:hypothetical protein